MELSTVNNFFYFMWNQWSLRTSMDLFGPYLGEHIWNKWIDEVGYFGPTAAVASFYAEIDNNCRQTIIEAANKHYTNENA